MTPKKQIIMALTGVAEIYGISISKYRLEGYLSMLDGKDVDLVIMALRQLTAESKWFPQVAEIMERVQQLSKDRETQKAKQLPDAPGLPDEDRAFNKVVFPIFQDYVNKRITRDEWLARCRWEAKKAGMEHKINWNEFPPPRPWD